MIIQVVLSLPLVRRPLFRWFFSFHDRSFKLIFAIGGNNLGASFFFGTSTVLLTSKVHWTIGENNLGASFYFWYNSCSSDFRGLVSDWMEKLSEENSFFFFFGTIPVSLLWNKIRGRCNPKKKNQNQEKSKKNYRILKILFGWHQSLILFHDANICSDFVLTQYEAF